MLVLAIKTIKYAYNPPFNEYYSFVEGKYIDIPDDEVDKFCELGYIEAMDEVKDNTENAHPVQLLVEDMTKRDAKDTLEVFCKKEFDVDIDKRVRAEDLITQAIELYDEKYAT